MDGWFKSTYFDLDLKYVHVLFVVLTKSLFIQTEVDKYD